MLNVHGLLEYCHFFPGRSDYLKCPASWVVDNMEFDDYDFWYVHQGEGTLHVNEKTFEIGGDQLYFFKPGDRISAAQQNKNPLEVSYCHLLF